MALYKYKNSLSILYLGMFSCGSDSRLVDDNRSTEEAMEILLKIHLNQEEKSVNYVPAARIKAAA